MSATTLDQQFVEFVIKSIVSKPDAVSIVRSVDEKGVLLELTVDPEDLGRVIGKHGGTAQSVRTLLRALGTKNEARYNLKIIDNGAPRPERAERPERVEDTMSTRPEAEQTVAKSEEPAAKESESLSKTRQELHDLDDLDI